MKSSTNQKKKNYVTDKSGTSVVHCAPAFGEDDYRVCVENLIINNGEKSLIVPVDEDGRFTEKIKDLATLTQVKATKVGY